MVYFSSQDYFMVFSLPSTYLLQGCHCVWLQALTYCHLSSESCEEEFHVLSPWVWLMEHFQDKYDRRMTFLKNYRTFTFSIVFSCITALWNLLSLTRHKPPGALELAGPSLCLNCSSLNCPWRSLLFFGVFNQMSLLHWVLPRSPSPLLHAYCFKIPCINSKFAI